MSEPTMSQRRILEYLECLEDKAGTCSCENPLDATMVEDECTEAINAIRRLIEARPEVTRDFVQKWAERMSFDTGSVLGKVQPQIYQLKEMLKEAGVEMEEEYKEA